MVFGIDEVGRGCFAGPLVASAVCFNKELKDTLFQEINDSKLIKPSKREELAKYVRDNAICFGKEISVAEIDKNGVEKANAFAFKALIKSIHEKYKDKEIYFLIDGRKMFNDTNTEFMIKGDQKSVSIAAASIIAKVYRDTLMTKLESKYPEFNFSKNKGYGTKSHRDAIKTHGLTALHRKSFKLDKFLK
jgi:ribonuclease HII